MQAFAIFLFAFAARAVFGWMASVAYTSAFENPAPTLFQSLSSLWAFLAFLIPAVAIGGFFKRRVFFIALFVDLLNGPVVYFWYDHGLPYPEPNEMLLLFARELAVRALVAACSANLVWLIAKGLRKPAAPPNTSLERTRDR